MGLPARAGPPDRRIWTGPKAGMGHAFVIPGDPDRVLRTGDKVRAQIVDTYPLPGLLDALRRQVTGLALLVYGERENATYRANVALYVPQDMRHLLKEGNILPARVSIGKRYVIVLDWEKAVADAATHDQYVAGLDASNDA